MITVETSRPVLDRFHRRMMHELRGNRRPWAAWWRLLARKEQLAAQQKPANTSGYRRQRRKHGRHWDRRSLSPGYWLVTGVDHETGIITYDWRDAYDALLADRGSL